MEARYGTLVMKTNTAILTYKDPNATGRRHFRVYTQNAVGFVASSAILTVDMNKPDQVTVTTLTVNQAQSVNSKNVQVNENRTYAANFLSEIESLFRRLKTLIEAILRMGEQVIKLVS